MPAYIHLKIKRQNEPNAKPYWQEFKIPYNPNMNVVSALMVIRQNPVEISGKVVDPVVWECNCLEEVCGACTMLINGMPRQACSALIDNIFKEKGSEKPIILEPLSKFPTIRDLMVDRKVMFDNLKKVKAWIPVDGTWDYGSGLRISEETQQLVYPISRCMTCGACMEACPNVNKKSKFIGPSSIAQVRLLNAHPIGAMHKKMRLKALTQKGGIHECGNAQNCKRVCPKNINLTRHIAYMNREVNSYALRQFLEEE